MVPDHSNAKRSHKPPKPRRNGTKQRAAHTFSNYAIITTPCLHMPTQNCLSNPCLFYWNATYGNIPAYVTSCRCYQRPFFFKYSKGQGQREETNTVYTSAVNPSPLNPRLICPDTINLNDCPHTKCMTSNGKPLKSRLFNCYSFLSNAPPGTAFLFTHADLNLTHKVHLVSLCGQ